MNDVRPVFLVLVSVVCLSFTPLIANAASYQRAPEVKVYSELESGYTPVNGFFAYDSNFLGGGSVAVADLGGGGTNEIITAAGYGGAPHVRTFNLDGSFLTQFYAYQEDMHAGINVAAGDLDGNGAAEIVTAPKQGAGPHVRVFNSSGQVKLTVGFYAYDEAFHGGVNVAVGDVNGDGRDEIITGSGIDSGSHVRVFSGDGAWLGRDYFPFAENMRGGVSVAVGNVDGGDESEIITAVQSQDQSQGQAWVKVYKYNDERTVLGEWKVFADDFTGGVNVASGDVDGDGEDEVIVSVAGKGGPQVKMFEAYGEEINPGFMAYEEDFLSGVTIAVGQTDGSVKEEVVTMPSKLRPQGRTDVERYVRVDLSEQRMYAYEYGYEVNTFLISSGLPATPTPPGEYHIQRKLYSHLYAGPGYYLPNTLYNLQFRTSYYLHGAYWHNNFGHPMSHGCVNISYPDAAWLFGWMQVGDLAVIEY